MLRKAAWLVVLFSLLSIAIEAPETGFSATPKFDVGTFTQL
jgi:hypothetical protein